MKLGLVILIIFINLLATGSVFGAAPDFQCPVTGPRIIEQVNFDFVPNYFAKVFPTKKIAAIIAGNGNWLIDTTTGKQTQVWGSYDPVPTPDEIFVASMDRNSGLRFTLFDDIVRSSSPGTFPDAWTSSNFNTDYAYESLALRPSTALVKNYRLLVDDDKGDVYIRDVNFTFKEKNDTSPDFKEGDWVKVCPNIQHLFKLPMISKDGNMVSLYDVKRGQTVVFNIDNAGQCKEKEAIPYQTGKADFSYDGRYVSFHVEKGNMNPVWFQYADAKRKMDVYVWDMKDHVAHQITKHENNWGNSYFPSFRKDGTIGFLQQSVNSANQYLYAYVVVDPDLEKPKSSSPDCCSSDDFAHKVGLGVLWAFACNLKDQMSITDAEELTKKMPLETCKKVVDEDFNLLPSAINQIKDQTEDKDSQNVAKILKSIPKSALMAACQDPTNKVAQTAGRSGATSQAGTPAESIKKNCIQCHGGNSPAKGFSINFDNLRAMPLEKRAKMADFIDHGTMPPGGMPPDQRAALKKFLLPQ